MPMVREDQLFTDNGIQRTRGLFKEVAQEGDNPIFTLGRDKDDEYICLRALFIEMVVNDPTEVEFAELVFGDYKYWQKIEKSTWIREHLAEWRETATVKRKAKAFKNLIKEASEGKGATAITAARYVIEEPWAGKGRRKAQATKATTAKATGLVKDDIERLKEQGLIN